MGFWAHLDRRALFERGDVYRVAFDAERAARTPVRVAVLGAGGVAQSKYLPALAQLRTRWEPVELVALSTLDARGAEKLSSLWGVPAYADSAALLREHAPDAVLVTIPDAPRERLGLVIDACALAQVPCRFVRRHTDLDPRAALGATAD